MPFIFNYYPQVTFIPEDSSIELPEFHDDSHLFVPEDDYNFLKDDAPHQHIFKIWKDDGHTIRIVPSDSVHTIDPERLDKIDVHLLSYKPAVTGGPQLNTLKYRELDSLDDDDYTCTNSKIFLNNDVHDRIQEEYRDRRNGLNEEYRVVVIFEIKFDKYESVGDDVDNNKKAIMQGIQASIFDYFYEAYLATESQTLINEIAYTILLTLLTSAALRNWGSMFKEPLEELIRDPTLEILGTEVAKELGADAYGQILGSVIGEGLGEMSLGDLRTSQKTKIKTKTKSSKSISQQQKTQTRAAIASSAVLSLIAFIGCFTGIGVVDY